MSVQQSTYNEPSNAAPSNLPQTPPGNSSAYNQPRNVAPDSPKMASSDYRTAQSMVQLRYNVAFTGDIECGKSGRFSRLITKLGGGGAVDIFDKKPFEFEISTFNVCGHFVILDSTDFAVHVIDSTTDAAGVEVPVGLKDMRQMICCFDKMDATTPKYSKARYDEIGKELSSKLKTLGLNPDQIPFVPISACQGDNIIERSSNFDWYEGLTVIEELKRIMSEPSPSPPPNPPSSTAPGQIKTVPDVSTDPESGQVHTSSENDDLSTPTGIVIAAGFGWLCAAEFCSYATKKAMLTYPNLFVAVTIITVFSVCTGLLAFLLPRKSVVANTFKVMCIFTGFIFAMMSACIVLLSVKNE